MLNRYNLVAKTYDFIARLVHGDNLIKAEKFLINHLPKNGHVLMIGGGTGKLLPEVFIQSPLIKLDYVESSSKMIEIAKTNAVPNQKITYFHSEELPEVIYKYDAVYIPFVLDYLPESALVDFINKARNLATPNTIWLIADFSINRVSKYTWYYKLHIRLSILFFRIFANRPLNYLPEVFDVFQNQNFTTLNTNHLQNGFVCSQILKDNKH